MSLYSLSSGTVLEFFFVFYTFLKDTVSLWKNRTFFSFIFLDSFSGLISYSSATVISVRKNGGSGDSSRKGCRGSLAPLGVGR